MKDEVGESAWKQQKREILEQLRDAPIEAKRIFFRNALSDVRALAKAYDEQGPELWQHLPQTNPNEYDWFYQAILERCKDFQETEAYQEYEQLTQHVFELTRDARWTAEEFDWFYDLSKPDAYYEHYAAFDDDTMYLKLARKFAGTMYQELIDHLLRCARQEPSSGGPTVWEQMKADVEAADPFWCEDALEAECDLWLKDFDPYSLALLWLCACKGSDDFSLDYYNEGPENTDFKHDIFRAVAQELYQLAEEENAESEEAWNREEE